MIEVMLWMGAGSLVGSAVMGLAWLADRYAVRADLEAAVHDGKTILVGGKEYRLVDTARYARMNVAFLGAVALAKRRSENAAQKAQDYADAMTRHDRERFGAGRPEHDMTTSCAPLRPGT